MKFSLFAVLLVVAGAYTLPQNEIENRDDRFIIVTQIRSFFEKLSQDIREAGLDPLHIREASVEYIALPGLIEFEAFLDQFEFNGGSNIVVNRVAHSGIFRRISFDLILPELRMSTRNSGIDAKVFGTELAVRLSGGMKINQIRLTGHVNYSIINTGITGISLNFSLDAIESNVRLIAFGVDYTEHLTTFLSVTIIQTIREHEGHINKLLEDIVMELIKRH